MNSIAPLLAADETFTHQVTDTFAAVGVSDPAWTEKVCAMAMARDGSLQIGFGLGKYTNRNVMDAYAAVSRGKEQLTVRASRRLATAPGDTVVGPIHYEVVRPLEAVRFRLEAGHMLFCDNTTVAHDRDAYETQSDAPRWLCRLWLQPEGSPS